MEKPPKEQPAALVLVGAAAESILDRRADLRNAVRDYIEKSEAASTRRARFSDWNVFTSWCCEHGVAAMPAAPETMAAFLADQSNGTPGREPKAVATLIRYSRSISAQHRIAGFPSPTEDELVRKELQGIRRARGMRTKQKEPLTAALLAEVLGEYERQNASRPTMVIRDRALILLGLATALRRSELCGLDVEDLHDVDGGVVIDLRRSKTDQEGRGRVVAAQRLDPEFARFCPVSAVEAWLEVAQRERGPLFSGLKRNQAPKTTRLTEDHVGVVVRRVAAAGGIENFEEFGAHSLRAGYVTTARQQGVDWGAIMEQTGHRRLETVKLYARYTPDVFVATRVGEVFKNAFRSKA